jgi:putative transposase
VLPEISVEAKVVAVDVNENIIAHGNDELVKIFETNEGIIRNRYFVKRRRIQLKVRGRRPRAMLLWKYNGREWRRIREIYYRAAKEIIGKALEVGATVIVMENLERLNEKDKGSKELNGQLHHWSYRKFQNMLDYEARLHGLNTKYVDPKNTSSLCPVCRLRGCRRCGLEEDRDVIAVKNLVKRYYEECMSAEAELPSKPPET